MKKCDFAGHKFEKKKYKPGQRPYQEYFCERKGCRYETDYPQEHKWDKTIWTSDEWETIKRITLILLWMVFIVALFTFGFIFVGKHSCDSYGNMGINVMYDFWNGCMAKHEKYGWVPVVEYFKILNLYIK
jgi:hypothetical protein